MTWWRRGLARAVGRGLVLASDPRIDSPNGFEREAGVRQAERLRDPAMLQPLLARVNDWVPQVRHAAQGAVRSFLQPEFLAPWCSALDAVLGLERASRADHAGLLEDIRRYLGRPEHLPAVVAAAAHGPERHRRFVFALQWVCADSTGRVRLLRQALEGRDRLLARMAAARLNEIGAHEDRIDLAVTGCASAFGPVRAQSLRVLCATDAPHSLALALALCLDPSAAVRSAAWQHAQGSPEAITAIEAARREFEQAGSSGAQRAALEFLVATGRDNALEICERAMACPQPRVRAVALGALLGWTPPEQREQWLLRGLRDPAPRVQRVAVLAVVRAHATAPAGRTVMDIAFTHGTAAALRNGFRVLATIHPWERLRLVLQAMGAPLPEGGPEACIAALDDWRRDSFHNFMPLPASLRQPLQAEWSRVAALVPVTIRRQIASQLA